MTIRELAHLFTLAAKLQTELDNLTISIRAEIEGTPRDLAENVLKKAVKRLFQKFSTSESLSVVSTSNAMRQLVLLSFVAVLCPAFLRAGPMSGAIFFNGNALRRAPISIACPGGSASGFTLDDGSYRINVPPEGRCTFTVTGPGFQASAVVFSYPTAAQYDFVVVRVGNGYELRRR